MNQKERDYLTKRLLELKKNSTEHDNNGICFCCEYLVLRKITTDLLLN